MASSQLRVFVSSKMQELAPERLVIKAALEELKVDGWVFEKDAGARPQTIQQTYLEEVEGSDLYIGLFWRGYGDYTVEEYEHARRLGKDCLIYEKRVDIDGRRDAQLEKFLADLGAVEKGVTTKWFNTPEELKELVKQDVARWQAEIVRRYKVSGAPLTYQPLPPAEDRVRKDLSILLNKVEQFWIKGVLEHSVHHQVLIELGKKKMVEAVEHPWGSVLELPREAEEPVPAGGRITDWFADVGHYLLILGEPGSGKTTTMLELARDLIAQARKDTGQPIPTVFNLSSWAGKGEPIADWMVRELKDKYQVPQKTGRMWLEQHLLLPLLDGLDEVNPDLQSACVGAINEFVQEYPSGLVVCSRLQEYTSQPARLKLNGAVCLQPLSPQQVDEYLEKAGPSLAALKDALKGDDNLRELIKTPLMLSIMSLAYEGQHAGALESVGSETIEGRRGRVFNTYIDRMVQRKGTAGQLYGKERLNAWLGWLAGQMKSHSQSVFLIEQLQADWLATRRQRACYIIISCLSAGLLIGSGFGIAVGMITGYADGSVNPALQACLNFSALGVLLGLVTALINGAKRLLSNKVELVRKATGFRRSIIDVGMYTLPWAVIALLWNGADSFRFETGTGDILVELSTSLALGLTHWFFFKARSEQHQEMGDITTVETLKWSWPHALKSGLRGACLIFIILQFIYSMDTIRMMETEEKFSPRRTEKINRDVLALRYVEREIHSLTEADRERLNDLIEQRASLEEQIMIEKRQEAFVADRLTVRSFIQSGVLFAVVGGVLGVLFGGFKEGVVERKTQPNQGVKLTVRNAAIKGATTGLLMAVFYGAIISITSPDLWSERPLLELCMSVSAVGVFVGLLVAFRKGGFDVIKHYSLRAVLVYSRCIPKDYVKFLNYATALILLQKVGGGYIFIHRTLLEHYAALQSLDHRPRRQG